MWLVESTAYQDVFSSNEQDLLSDHPSCYEAIITRFDSCLQKLHPVPCLDSQDGVLISLRLSHQPKAFYKMTFILENASSLPFKAPARILQHHIALFFSTPAGARGQQLWKHCQYWQISSLHVGITAVLWRHSWLSWSAWSMCHTSNGTFRENDCHPHNGGPDKYNTYSSRAAVSRSKTLIVSISWERIMVSADPMILPAGRCFSTC